ncbi:quaternary amine ABC transporter ATP-binding protein [Thermostichus vulcanus]|uniref:Glycine betaine/L-proline ABC transporter ATP-binding protein n=1 Tax=Thermostichus vulcanus str. 'Rupite' TaxID=2813851 RepID=A0ABT0CDV4_THEVL|nr:glycine betaine/L-proline ABC transporter ATP-binding protein [Thermostichus vulcanus]MCJ2543967.1 glycine betaine/L-proline ABC transporter ATP-binding protein [Thermostichus vulcanus str. 'Rupite']
MTAPEPKIRLENLSKIYGPDPQKALALLRGGLNREQLFQTTGHVLAVADISLSIQPGELFVIMGLSGSGKSTLVRCLNRLIPATAGKIYIDGENVLQVSEARLRQIRRQKMAMVFQKFALFPHRTVLENVEYGLKIQGVDPRQRRQRALETLERVGLQQWADRYPSDLSGGMQQRVGLARALATDPDILLMDEAFGALDPLIRREMQQELLTLQEHFQKTIVFITHDIQEALKIGDRVAIMRDGAFVQVGSPAELLTQPADQYVADFIQDVNRAQVLKTGAITRKTLHLILGRDSLSGAAAQMHNHDLNTLYVLDGQGRPVGVLAAAALAQALHAGQEDIHAAMQTNFPQVQASTSLEELFRYWDQEVPIAVVDREGRFKGVVEQSELFSIVGRLSQSRLSSSGREVGKESAGDSVLVAG